MLKNPTSDTRIQVGQLMCTEIGLICTDSVHETEAGGHSRKRTINHQPCPKPTLRIHVPQRIDRDLRCQTIRIGFRRTDLRCPGKAECLKDLFLFPRALMLMNHPGHRPGRASLQFLYPSPLDQQLLAAPRPPSHEDRALKKPFHPRCFVHYLYGS